MESDADLDRIPDAYVDGDLGGMRCSGDRCAALVGDVGISTACAIYAVRPDVCELVCREMTPAKWHDGASISKRISTVWWASQITFRTAAYLDI